MQKYKIDNKEFKSFKLQEKNLELKSFFINKNMIGIFMMSNTLHPKDRHILRKEKQEYSLKIKLISKKIIKLWYKSNNWNMIPNLLSGNVVKVSPYKKKILIKKHYNIYLNMKNYFYVF